MDGKIIRGKSTGLLGRFTQQIKARVKAFGYTTGFYRLRLKGKHPVKLDASPNNPWPGDLARGAEFLEGKFKKAGFEAHADDHNLWVEAEVGPPAFKNWLHSFIWLGDLATLADKKRAQARAENVLKDWAIVYGEWHEGAWRQDLIGLRIIYWTFYAPLILSSEDLVYRSKVLNALARQSRHLDRTALNGPDGLPRVQALVGLTISGLVMPFGEKRTAHGLKYLETELARLILADGGVITHSVRDCYEIAKILVILKTTLIDLNKDMPDWLPSTLDKMIPYIRAHCHGDGGFGQFNGAFECDSDGLEKLILLSDSKGKPIENAILSGFQRIKRKKTLVLMDVATSPNTDLNVGAHAGILSVEISDGRDRIIVNTGGSRMGQSKDRHGVFHPNRATAYHSGLTIGGNNSAPLNPDGTIGASDQSVKIVRNENEQGVWLATCFKGKNAGGQAFDHKRHIFMSEDGSDIRGEDVVNQIPTGLFASFSGPKPTDFTAYFHLHPSVTASLTREGTAVILRTGSGRGWLFRAKGGEVQLMKSKYQMSPHGDKRSSQSIVVNSVGQSNAKFNWSLRRLDSRD
jgi:uncharacterized heparinase superfamily protein